MPSLVLVRHGQSAWNLENRFTGWWDVDLTEKGVEEARAAGRALVAAGHDFDCAFTSVQTRAIKTLHLILEEMGRLWLPVTKDWRLNERHYGGLTGLDKAETAARHGEEQVKIWRRSFDVPPPAMEQGSPYDVSADRRYAGSPYDVSADRRYAGVDVPATESLKDTIARAVPALAEKVMPELAAGRRVLVVAHGNSLRGLVKHLSGLSDSDIVHFEIPTGVPIIYQLDEGLKATSRTFLSVA